VAAAVKVRGIAGMPLRAASALRRMVFRRDTWRWLTLPNARIDYAGEVGDGTRSSTVAATLNWIANTFPEAPPSLWRADREEEQVLDHDLLRLLQRPNAFFTGPELWAASVTDYKVDGNAYWLKGRSRAGTPVELWWTPSWMLEPKGDEKTFITHYEYLVNGQRIEIDPADVVHFRFGADPDDPRRGLSPVKSVLREVYTDDQAANYTAAILTNMGVPGLVISPKTGVNLKEEDADYTRAYVKEKFGGDNRGEAIVMSAATDVAQFGFSPEQLVLRELRRIPEERVTAALGIPAVVVGLGAGLDRSTFTNMAEAREAAYEAGIIPMQRILAEKIRFGLLPDFGEDPFKWRFGFDLARVRVLQEDLYRLAQRHALAVREGVEMVAEFRRALGLEVDDARDRIFLRPMNIEEVPADEGTRSLILAPTNDNGNSNGRTDARAVADEVVRAIERAELAKQGAH
jgi:HK97 family phage portal protein